MAGTMDDLIDMIYHEKQQEGSMLCAQHALNSLLQGPYFSAPDLSAIAQRLDALEERYDEGHGQRSTNMDDTGFFSVQVLEEALQVWGLTLARWRSEEMRPFQDHPHTQLAFVLNQHEHWYTLRRFGPALTHPADDPGEGHWFNLNSTLDRPEWISKLYLGMFLQQAETEGYSIFVVLQRDPAAPLALPRTEADEIAMAIPESSGTRAAPAAHTGIEGLEDEDMELQAALQASLMGGAAAYGLPQHGYPAPVSASSTDPIFGSRSGAHTPVQRHGYGVLAPPHGYEDEDEELDDPVIPDFVPGVPGSAAHDGDPLAASRARSEAYMARVLREQEAALRDSYAEEAARIEAGGAPRRNARAEQEEAELLRAIEESRAMHEALGDAPPPTAEPEPPRPARPLQADRVYDDEDAELQAALRASLETLPEGFRIPSTPPRGAPPPLPPASTRPVPSQSQPQPRPQAPQAEDDGFETESEADTEASASAAPEPQLSMDEIRRRRLAKFGG